jgi:hypothetical protein
MIKVKPRRSATDNLEMRIHRLDRVAIVALLTTCILAGCTTNMTPRELGTRLDRASETVPARQATRRVVPIYATTPMEALILRSEAKNMAESSSLSVRLARGFAVGRTRKVDYIVGGPYPKLSDQLVLNGLNMNEDRALPGLRIVFVSPVEPTLELRQAAKARRARLEHRILE